MIGKLLQHKFIVAEILIVILAAGLRFHQIETKMRFIWDEGRDMTAIYRIVADKNVTLFGPFNEMNGSKDFFGVFHYYLMAPSLWLTDFDPIGPALFTAMLGVVSVYLVFILVEAWTDKQLALLTSLFYAISPLVIKYVQWPWNPNTTPFFGLLYFLLISFFYRQKKHTLLVNFLAGLVLGLLFQLHYFTVVLGLPWLLVLLYKRTPKLNPQKKLLVSLLFGLGFILPNLSFVIFDLTHQFFYWNIIQESFVGESSQKFIKFSLTNLLTMPFNFLRQTLRELGLGLISSLMFVVVMIGFGYSSCRRFLSTNKIDLSILVFATLVSFLMLTSFFPKLSDLYHMAYLWWGVLFVIFYESRLILARKHYLFFVVSLLLLVSVQSIQFINKPLEWSQNMPQIRSLSQLIVEDLEQSPQPNFNIATFTDADTRGMRYRYFLLKNGFEAAGVDQYAQNQVIYIITPHDQQTTKENPAWEIESVQNAEWQMIGSQDSISVYKAVK